MGYRPKYGYTQFKKDRSSESDEGFKDHVVQYGDYYLYLNAHMQTSKLRRVTVKFHTMTVAVKHIRTGELMAELTSKGNFGFLAARSADLRKGFVPVREEDKAIQEADLARDPPRELFRVINVINERNQDPSLRYRPRELLRGVYEDWRGLSVCLSKPLSFVIRNPSTGIETRLGEQAVQLGEFQGSEFYQNLGISRFVRGDGVTIGAKACGFGDDFDRNGYFYTNADGTKLFDKSGENTVRQFIKPGFSLTITGQWRPMGNWLGLHTSRKRTTAGYFDHSYGLNPYIN